MHIALIAKPGHADSGVGRYSAELSHALQAQGHRITLVHPTVPLPPWVIQALRRWLRWDLQAFFENYPIWTTYPQADIYHITSQNLATLMMCRRPPGKTMITVHDILPYILRDDLTITNLQHVADRIFNHFAMWGMCRVQILLAVSEYTAQTLTEHFDIASERIFITWEGVALTDPAISESL